MILVLLPFCFCQLPDSFLLRLDVANHRPHSFAHHDGYHSLSSWVQSPVCLRGAPCHVRTHAVVEYGSYIALFDTLLLIVFCRRSADEKVPSVCWCICSWFFPTLLFCSSRSLWSLRWFTNWWAGSLLMASLFPAFYVDASGPCSSGVDSVWRIIS